MHAGKTPQSLFGFGLRARAEFVQADGIWRMTTLNNVFRQQVMEMFGLHFDRSAPAMLTRAQAMVHGDATQIAAADLLNHQME